MEWTEIISEYKRIAFFSSVYQLKQSHSTTLLLYCRVFFFPNCKRKLISNAQQKEQKSKTKYLLIRVRSNLNFDQRFHFVSSLHFPLHIINRKKGPTEKHIPVTI